MPPARCTSSMCHLPGGRDLAEVRHAVGDLVDAARAGIDARFDARWPACAARCWWSRPWPCRARRRCRTPRGVTMSRGGDVLAGRGRRCARPARRASASRSGLGARVEPLPGSARPSASHRQFMELAVNMPEQEPQVGQAVFQLLQLRSASILPAWQRADALEDAWPGRSPRRRRSGRPPSARRRRRRSGCSTRTAAISMPGDDLVAVGDADHAVEAVGRDHGLDAVGDQLARGQRVLHADVAHGDAVVDADGVELERHAARLAHRLLHDRRRTPAGGRGRGRCRRRSSRRR